ncbi:MAG: ABC transporter substrate-binding protein [Actinomycetota bacterium]
MKRRSRSVLRTSAVAIGCLMVAAACSTLGLTDSGGGAGAGDPATPVTAADGSIIVGGSVVEEDETIEDLEAQWAAQRGRVVDSLSGGSYGVGPDDILRGPGRMEIDLDDCPREWDDVEGLSSTTIKVGMIVAQSGQLSSFRLVADGMQAYFDYVNENGGIDGRRIQMVLRDDTYDPGVAQAAVEDLLETEQPFMVMSVGSPGSLAVYDDLNDACVPHPYVVSGHPAWGDPEQHPFTTGFQLSYTTEAIMWGSWIRANLAGSTPVRVAALVSNNDFGRIYADAFENWAEANPDVVSEVEFVRHPPAALDVVDEMEEIAELQPQVFISMTTGQPCISAVAEAERLGLTDRALALFNPSVCKQPSSYMVPLGNAGDQFLVVGSGMKSTADPAFEDDTFVEFVNTRLEESGLDPDQMLVAIGFAQYGWAQVETLRLASALPGGLSRSNLTLAMRNIDLQHPMLFDGVRFSTEGFRDAFVIEGAEVSRYNAAERAWFQEGAPIDLNGTSPFCTWDELRCR